MDKGKRGVPAPHGAVVCNVRAPYSGDWNFRQCLYAIWYFGHLWPFEKLLRKSSQV